MGEAKRRARAYDDAKAKLIASLSDEGKVVASSAIGIFEGFIAPQRYTGGCYLVTMTLHRYLADEHGIKTVPVIGYVNDGTDDIFISHAWLEHEGLKTDLTLHQTEYPDIQLPGAVLVMDQPIRQGVVQHTYHVERTDEGMKAAQRMLAHPETAAIAKHKEQEHLDMVDRAQSRALMDAYLQAAPIECGYAAMTAPLRRS